MTSALLETEAGRAMLAVALRDGALTVATKWPRFPLPDPREPWPHYVHYSVGIRLGRTTYTPPDSFYFTRSKPGPSDCVWIVPGTARC